MTSTIRSLAIWSVVGVLIVCWLPLLAIIRLLDSDPAHYRTGLWFRKLGIAITRINPNWKMQIAGQKIENPRNPYVVVGNHQSHADIPLISNLPWEMKWMVKAELFRILFIGQMLRLAGDIPVERGNRRKAALAFLQAARYLDQKCSVMFFPEGTRSPDGMVHQFAEGAFHLAIKSKVPILPLAVDGSRDCLPKNSWRIGKVDRIFLKVLPPVRTDDLQAEDVSALRDRVRAMIIAQVAEWRNVPPEEVDGNRSLVAVRD